jgi:hypothetical protein
MPMTEPDAAVSQDTFHRDAGIPRQDGWEVNAGRKGRRPSWRAVQTRRVPIFITRFSYIYNQQHA